MDVRLREVWPASNSTWDISAHGGPPKWRYQGSRGQIPARRRTSNRDLTVALARAKQVIHFTRTAHPIPEPTSYFLCAVASLDSRHHHRWLARASSPFLFPFGIGVRVGGRAAQLTGSAVMTLGPQNERNTLVSGNALVWLGLFGSQPCRFLLRRFRLLLTCRCPCVSRARRTL